MFSPSGKALEKPVNVPSVPAFPGCSGWVKARPSKTGSLFSVVRNYLNNSILVRDVNVTD
jgi:hypothetical protein